VATSREGSEATARPNPSTSSFRVMRTTAPSRSAGPACAQVSRETVSYVTCHGWVGGIKVGRPASRFS